VQAGTVLDELNAAAAGHGLVFGPKPATHNHCTLGGMIGNNSCGSTAQWAGTTAANVRRLEILTYDGTRMWVGPTSDAQYASIVEGGGRPAEIYRAVRELRDRYADAIRERFPDIPRCISGYNLPALLPENGFNLARASRCWCSPGTRTSPPRATGWRRSTGARRTSWRGSTTGSSSTSGTAG
jgi:hypothetical protein